MTPRRMARELLERMEAYGYTGVYELGGMVKAGISRYIKTGKGGPGIGRLLDTLEETVRGLELQAGHITVAQWRDQIEAKGKKQAAERMARIQRKITGKKKRRRKRHE